MTQDNTSAGLLADEQQVLARVIEEEALVSIFRTLPLHGDAGCDKLTDEEWVIVAKAALALRQSAAPASEADMAAFGASDTACYHYPGEDQASERAAFCEGAAHAASRPSESAEAVELLKDEAARVVARWEHVNESQMREADCNAMNFRIHALNEALAKLDAQGGAGDAE